MLNLTSGQNTSPYFIINTSSSENVHPLLSSHIKTQWCIYLELVIGAWSVHISLPIQKKYFSTEESNIIDRGLI